MRSIMNGTAKRGLKEKTFCQFGVPGDPKITHACITAKTNVSAEVRARHQKMIQKVAALMPDAAEQHFKIEVYAVFTIAFFGVMEKQAETNFVDCGKCLGFLKVIKKTGVRNL